MTLSDAPAPVPWLAGLLPAIHGSFDASSAERTGQSLDEILDFSANGNVIGPPPGVSEAISRVDLSRYPDREATLLRRAIGERHGVASEMVVVGNGSSELIWAVARAYLQPGQCALVLGPTYGEYEVAVAAVGGRATVLQSSWREGTVDVASIASQAASAQPRLIWLCHPNNPTGIGLPDELVPTLLREVPGAMLVIDEAYLPLCRGLLSMIERTKSGRVLVLRSMTKDAALAGLRIGYLIAAVDVASVLRRALPPWSVSSVAQAAGLIALADHEHAEQARAAVAASRDHLLVGLRRLGLEPYLSMANFVLVPVGDGAAVQRALLDRGCAVRDATSFGLPDCIRIGVRAVADQERLLTALGEVVDG